MIDIDWQNLDDSIRLWWDSDVVQPDDDRLVATRSVTLPFPYVAVAGPTSPSWLTAMFNWDTYFVNLALLVHGREDLVRGNIENYLALIERYGFMPNANEVALVTRSQTPVFPESIWRYVEFTGDDELLARAYPLLVTEYSQYWLAEHHATPNGLVTNRDLLDTELDPRLSAEAETGMDWTTQFDGDVRQTNPVITNCALVVYARVLSAIATRLDKNEEAASWESQAQVRSNLIRRLCWSEERGQFLDYNYVTDSLVSVIGATSYWAMWAGVASEGQAKRMVEELPTLLFDYGLVTTEESKPDPDRFALPYEDLQWTYPAGWPPLQIIACWGLDRYGYATESKELAQRFTRTILQNYSLTGELYEKYNVVDGTLVMPNSRYGTLTMHGWTSSAAVLLGRRSFQDQTIEEMLTGHAR